jgi:hypothetical protein
MTEDGRWTLPEEEEEEEVCVCVCVWGFAGEKMLCMLRVCLCGVCVYECVVHDGVGRDKCVCGCVCVFPLFC